jgi:hypothetical protein
MMSLIIQLHLLIEYTTVVCVSVGDTKFSLNRFVIECIPRKARQCPENDHMTYWQRCHTTISTPILLFKQNEFY